MKKEEKREEARKERKKLINEGRRKRGITRLIKLNEMKEGRKKEREDNKIE